MPPQSRPTIRDRLIVPIVLVGLVIVGWLISHFVMVGQSLRLDEAQSLWQTSHSLAGTLKVVAEDVHMPLYHIILHYWQIVFGNGIESARLLSFIFFASTIPFVYLLARMIVSRQWALFAATLFTISPFVSWYASEIRMYTLLALVSVVNQYFFMRILQRKSYGWLGYIISAIVGAYTHYFFFFGLITQGLFYLFNRTAFPKYTLRKLVGTALLVIAAVSPWIYFFIKSGAASNTKPLIAQPSAIDFFNVYSQFLFGFQDTALNTILIAFWPLITILALVLVKRFNKPEPTVLYCIVAAFIPVLLAFGLSFVVTPFFLSRYMIAAVVPLFIIICWILSHRTPRVSIIGAAIVIVLTCGVFIHQQVSADTPVKEDYAAVAERISQTATPSDLIVISSPFTVYPFEYYYKGTSQIKTLPIWDRGNAGAIPGFNTAKLPSEVDTLKKDHDYIYLVLSYSQGYEQKIRDYFRDHFELVFKHTYSSDVDLFVYRVGYKDAIHYTH